MHDEFDTLIDSAVKSYAAAEPSPELATGILRRVHLEPQPRRAHWKLAIALAVPVAAAVAMMVVLLAGPLAMPPAPEAVTITPAVPQMQDASAQVRAGRTPSPAHAHRVRAKLAQSTIRPLPIQYTRQELMLLSFVQRYPKEAAAIAEAQVQDMQPVAQHPVAIARLKIAPLNISALNPEN